MSAPAHGPSVAPRPTGGFSSGHDQFGEHLDEAALQQAVSQKQLGQQQATATGSPQGVPTGSAAPTPPREMGSIAEELVTRPLVDIAKGVATLFDFSAALGMKPPETKTPEEKQRMAATHQRYQQLNQEQQAYAKKEYQRRLQEKQQQEEMEEQRRQQQQAASQDIVVPTSTQKGPVGPTGSSKQRAVTKLQHDRQTLGGPASAN